MPYSEKTLPGGKIQVKNKITGKITAKATTPKKAEAQRRLLEAIRHGTKKW